MSTTKRAVADPIKKIEQKVLKVEPKTNEFVKKIQKREGSVALFDLNKITNAIHKAMLAASEGSYDEAEMVATKVLADLVRITKKYKNFVPTVEGVQDTVEKELILSEYVGAAKAYILYRDKRFQVKNREHKRRCNPRHRPRENCTAPIPRPARSPPDLPAHRSRPLGNERAVFL